MKKPPHCSEYDELVSISLALQSEHMRENAAWKDSPFAWIKLRPSRSIGAIGEKMLACWLTMHDFNVKRSPDSQADRIVEDKRVEIKFSTLWENGTYTFQQIRNQNYDFMVMLGISPHDAHCWVISKSELMDLHRKGFLPGQHTGRRAADTAWIKLSPSNDNPHFAPFGNDLNQALRSISRLTGFQATKISN